MSNRVEVLPKLGGETVPRTVDFISKLPSGVTISSADCLASVYSGNDANPSAMVQPATTISGTQVTQVITGGVVGTIYELSWSAVGSDGNTYLLSSYFAVTPDLP
jgi:hypothetical protein